MFNFFKNKQIKIEILIFLITLVFYTAITAGKFWESDSQTAYQAAKSMVDSLNFKVPCFWGTTAPNGNCYSQYGLMISIAVVPFYIIEKFFGHVLHNTFFFPGFFAALTNVFITSLLVTLIFKYLKRIVNLNLAIFGTFIFAVATYLPAYTKTLYSEPLETLLVFISLYLLLFFKHTKKILLYAGLFFGLAFLTKIAVLIFGVVILYIFYSKKTSVKYMFYFLLPIILSILIFFGYNYVRFGNVLDTGYKSIKFNYPLFDGLYLHILSPGKSFLLYQPVIIFAFLGFKNFFRKEKMIFISFAILTLVNLLFYSVYMDPTGDLTWGSRYIYPSLGFFIFGTVFFIKYNRAKILKILFVVALISSILIQCSSIYLSYHRYFSFLSKQFTGLAENHKNKYTEVAYRQIAYSPIIGQWRLIFRLGYQDKDYIAWREAFQEYYPFNLNYRVAPPDILLVRSKRELPVFIILLGIDIFLIYKVAQIYKEL